MAQTSKAHEDYLREMSIRFKDATMLSIDYSLTPYPRVLEEIFYVYCWALENSNFLGTTAEKVILLGDSAGGNVATSIVIKCIEAKIRVPDLLVAFYTFFYMEFLLTPSRILTFIGPILHIKCISNMLNYYMTGEIEANKFKDNGQEMRKGNYYVSPYLAPKEILEKFPSTMIIATNYDEGIDDSVEFAKKLRSFKVDVNLKIFKDLHHGFLHFILVSGNLQI